ncbi:MAG TPA: segregation/condensation protein A [Firmicutes bacterium]|jgi:segregation and condensation protein A|nr:segregation/condensation protein A [Bacillota bacterium]HBT16740.1 segregation/condensation protein A [Bacillota bacterium]
MEEQDVYQIKLDVFEGPLDLLLHLIERAEIDIYNIPIVEVTDQFLAYLQTMELLNLQMAADFLLMAATLMQIKARMLLPRPAVETEDDEEDEGDPRLELVERLLEYKKVKEIASELKDKEMQSSKYFSRSGGYFPDRETATISHPAGEVTLWDLVQAFGTLLESLIPRLELEGMPQEQYSIQDKMEDIIASLARKPQVYFSVLFANLTSKKAMVTSFLALLELIRLRKVVVQQEQVFGEIVISRWED